LKSKTHLLDNQSLGCFIFVW